MQKKLTSHFINGDLKTNFFQKFIYTLFFLVELIYEKKMIGYKFNINNYKLFLEFFNYNEEILKQKTPARILQEFFIFELLSKNYNKEDAIKVLDIGCGDGRFCKFISKYFKNIQYFGIDYKNYSEWDNLKSDAIQFKSIDLNETDFKFLDSYSNVDLIFSQSALEHIKYDLNLLTNLNKLFPSAKNVHLVPSCISFLNYLTHGYRRYNYNDLKKLSKFLNKDIKISKLGDYAAVRSYFNYYYDVKKIIRGKKLHPFNFFMFKNTSYNENLIKKILFEDKSSYPLFYAIEY